MYAPGSGPNVEILFADRKRCPVCGNPTGDCVGDSPYHGQANFIPKKKPDPDATFRVPRRVYEEKMIGNKLVKTLVYPVGAAITTKEAQRLGFLPK